MTGKPTTIGMTGIPVMTIKPENELPLRHELKHRINLREDLVLSQRLKKLFPHDKNAGPDGTYRVTSLYFDTPYDSALREKRPVRQAQRPDDAGTGKNAAFRQL